jgi:hypothetical protein
VLLEAHGTTHFWARAASEWGHRGVLVPPHVVRRHVLVDKTERADAKGLLEAVRNEDVGPVPIESVKQQVLVSLHRMDSGLRSSAVLGGGVVAGDQTADRRHPGPVVEFARSWSALRADRSRRRS